MIIDLYNIISRNGECQKCNVPIEMTSFKSTMGDFPVVSKSDLSLEFKNNGDKNITLTSSIDITFDVPCARCLTPVKTRLSFDSSRTLNYGAEDPDADEFLSDMSFIEGTNFDTERYAYSEVLENFPLRVLCKEDCKGVCTVCGKNLNEGECGCDRTVIDPRMAQFMDMFNKMND